MNTKKIDYNLNFKQKAIGSGRLLLHVCCAPCLGAALPKLKNLDVTCLFFNPNILPSEEYQKRFLSVQKLVGYAASGALGDGYEKLKLVELGGTKEQFFEAIKGKEKLGEHSARCQSCIEFRLQKTYEFAKENGFLHFATTLTSSPHKDAEKINQIGASLGKEMYLESDFKKESGALFSKDICEKLGLYRQVYCGCNLPSNKVFTPFKIGNVLVPNRLLLAPMAGYTDVGFRYVAKLCGAGLTYTEMVSAKALVFGNEKTDLLLKTTDIEVPKAVQIFGSDAKSMCQAVCLDKMKNFDIIDVNMGCPMPKIVKNGDGSALLLHPQKAAEIVQKLARTTNKPITIKFRKCETDQKTIEFAKAMEKAGASAITIHGRTPSQLYSGKSDREILKKIVAAVNIPVIYSGDVASVDEAEEILKMGASAVMIGRAAVGNPQVFGLSISASSAIVKQIEVDIAHLGEKQTMMDVKKHLASYFKGEKNAVAIRKALLEATSFEEVKAVLASFANV